jgi:hypothetical protein
VTKFVHISRVFGKSARKPVDAYRLLLERYVKRIPIGLRDILVPRGKHARLELARAIKALKIREEERNYVRELQRVYELPLRPNESVKRTMIRVRLKIVEELRQAAREGRRAEYDDKLPTDPLD